MDASCEEAFVGIDIPDTSDEVLIEQSGFDWPGGPLAAELEVGGVEFRAERFGAKSLQTGDHGFRRAIGRDPPHLTEAAQINEAKLLLLGIPDSNARVTACLGGFLMPLELSSHAQMDTPYPTVGMKCAQQIFPTSAPGTQCGPSQCIAENGWVVRTCDGPGPTDFEI